MASASCATFAHAVEGMMTCVVPPIIAVDAVVCRGHKQRWDALKAGWSTYLALMTFMVTLFAGDTADTRLLFVRPRLHSSVIWCNLRTLCQQLDRSGCKYNKQQPSSLSFCAAARIIMFMGRMKFVYRWRSKERACSCLVWLMASTHG